MSPLGQPDSRAEYGRLMEWVVILLVIVLIWLVVRVATGQPGGGQSRRPVDAVELEQARGAAAVDVDRFGEEVQQLEFEVQLQGATPALIQDWQRALDSYDTAKQALSSVARPEDVQKVTAVLEDGRYAVACVRARRAGKPLPERRPAGGTGPEVDPDADGL